MLPVQWMFVNYNVHWQWLLTNLILWMMLSRACSFSDQWCGNLNIQDLNWLPFSSKWNADLTSVSCQLSANSCLQVMCLHALQVWCNILNPSQILLIPVVGWILKWSRRTLKVDTGRTWSGEVKHCSSCFKHAVRGPLLFILCVYMCVCAHACVFVLVYAVPCVSNV